MHNEDLKKAFMCNQQNNKEKDFAETPTNFPLCLVSSDHEVWFLVGKVTIINSDVPVQKPVKNAFLILMKSSEAVLVPPTAVKNKKTELYNDILSLSKVVSPQNCVKSFELLIQHITNCLWAIDCNQAKFILAEEHGNCKKLPEYFESLYKKEYREYKSQKKKNRIWMQWFCWHAVMTYLILLVLPTVFKN